MPQAPPALPSCHTVQRSTRGRLRQTHHQLTTVQLGLLAFQGEAQLVSGPTNALLERWPCCLTCCRHIYGAVHTGSSCLGLVSVSVLLDQRIRALLMVP